MTTDDWYMEMANLIKERDRANAMILNWTQKLADAEGAIEQLRAQPQATAPATATEE